MVVADKASKKPAVVLLGSAGRLGRLLTLQLPQLGWATIGITRTGTTLCRPAVDVTESRWSRSASWRSVVGGWPPVAGIVNLVTGREPDPGQAETGSRAAVAVMRAVAEAAGDPLMLHVGSIAEASAMPRSAYAAGKIAARQVAAADGRVAVLTLAIVPREHGAKADRSLRTLCRLSPSVARLPIPVTSGQTFAHTLALVLGDGTAAAGKQMVLAAHPQPLSRLLGTRVLAGSLGDVAARILVTAPTGRMLDGRARSLARAALGSALVEHYAAAIPPTADLVTPGTGQLVARRNDDGLGDWWLLPADIGERQAAHV